MLRKFRDIHKGKTCVILGNGKLLGKTPRDLLEKYITFGTNKIFLTSTDPDGLLEGCEGLAGFIPDYWICVDKYMIHDCTPVLYSGWWPKKEDGVFVPRRDNQGYSPGYPVKKSNQVMLAIESSFSVDINEKIVIGGTVTYVCLQMAYYMGFSTALLVGIDHDYGKYNEKKPHSVFIAEGEDNSHFHKRYFEHGHIYAAAALGDTPMSYRLAHKVFEMDNRRILNLTPGTRLQEIPLGKFKEWLQ